MEDCEWGNGIPPPDVAQGRALPGFFRGTLGLARGDTAEALRRLLALPDSAFADDWRVRLLKFQVLAALGRDRDAARVFDGRHLPAVSPRWVLGVLERGRVAERRWRSEPQGGTGLLERARAVECYKFVADVWRHADPELQPYVAEARKAMARVAPG